MVEFEDRRRIIVGRDEILSVEPPRGRSSRPAERSGRGREARPGGRIPNRRRTARSELTSGHELDAAEPVMTRDDDDEPDARWASISGRMTRS